MPTPPESDSAISPEAFRSLLSIAGLDVSEEQAPLVLAELAAQRNNARLIDELLRDEGPASGKPYDPAFPKFAVKDRAE